MNEPQKLLPVGPAARKLRVPVMWLRNEAEAGRVPHLRAGKQFLFNLEVVERLLIARASTTTEQGVPSAAR